jgi:hypothetical protein
VSTLAEAILAELDDELLDALVERLVPRTAAILAEREAADGWLRGAVKIAAYIDCPTSRVYALASARRIPVERDGSNLLARRHELDAWVRTGGGRRP